jgi:hypothetical protein
MEGAGEMETNRGTGAGGAATNRSGKTFEEKTSNESRLLEAGFVRQPIPGSKGKHSYYLEMVAPGVGTINYLTQGGLKAYFKHFFDKEMFRCPDEAYLFRFGSKNILKILEKKNQNVAGSVDTKLLAGIGFLEEYAACLGEDFEIHYAFCISDFLKKDYISDAPKYKILRKINEKYKITVLFGDNADYYTTLDEWISKSH